MELGIMQPYFFPYIGYFQLMNVVDEFVIYDNIQFSKKGWINRNRMLVNGTDTYFTIPLQKDSDFLDIRNRRLAESWVSEKTKVLNRMKGAYRKAPYFDPVYELIKNCILIDESNLFSYLLYTLSQIKTYLDINTPFIISSSIPIDHSLKAEKKVLEIVKYKKAKTYINPIGGMELYKKEDFKKEGIELLFLKSKNIEYKQFSNSFVPWLSIVDVMMFNSRETISEYLNNSYKLI